MCETANAGKLQQILDKTLALQEKIGWDIDNLSAEELTQKAIDNSVMLMGEAYECLDVLPWKKHKQNYGAALSVGDIVELREEAIDALHFVINLLVLTGVRTEQQLFVEFKRKNDINLLRQEQGY